MQDLMCPYCDKLSEVEYNPSEDGGNEFDFECPACGRLFRVEVDWKPIFSERKIKCHRCRADVESDVHLSRVGLTCSEDCLAKTNEAYVDYINFKRDFPSYGFGVSR